MQLRGHATACAPCVYRQDPGALEPALIEEAIILGLGALTRSRSASLAKVNAIQREMEALQASIEARQERLRQYQVEMDATREVEHAGPQQRFLPYTFS